MSAKFLVQEGGQVSGVKAAMSAGLAIVFFKLLISGVTVTYGDMSYASPQFDYSGAGIFIGALIGGVLGRKWVTKE